ncbi:hypothetical protein Gpo141_00007975 [Globisporangium polare]
MKTLVTRKKTRKRRMEAGMTHEDDSGRLFQPPSQRDPRWKKPSAHELVRAAAGPLKQQNKRQKTAHVPTTGEDDDDDDDDGFDVVAADNNDSEDDEAAVSSEDEESQSEAEEYDEENAVKHPLQYCTSLDDCVAKAAVKYNQIRKLDGRQKAKVLLLVETPSLRKALKNKLGVKQELVKSKSRVGIRSVKSNSMAYKNIAILKTPMERFEEANAEWLKDFKMGKLPTLIAEDQSFYPYSDLKINHVVFLAKTSSAAVNLDRKLLEDIKLHVIVVNEAGPKAVTEAQKAELAKLYAVKA